MGSGLFGMRFDAAGAIQIIGEPHPSKSENSVGASDSVCLHRSVARPNVRSWFRATHRCQIPIHSRDHIVAPFSRLVISFSRAAIENPRPTRLELPGAARRSSNPFQTLRAAQTGRLCPIRALMSEKEFVLSDFGQRRKNLKPKSYRLAGISYDENCRGDLSGRPPERKKCRGGRQSKSTVCVERLRRRAVSTRPTRSKVYVYVTLGSPANRHRISRLPADSLSLSNSHVRSGEGVRPRYRYRIHTVTQNAGQLSGI